MIYIFIVCAVAAVFTALLFVRKTLFSVHMLQQSAYRNSDFLKWCDDNLSVISGGYELFIIALSLAFFLLTRNFQDSFFLSLINGTISLVLLSFRNFPIKKYSTKNAKKPLVFTARVKRLLVAEFTLFVLLTLVMLYISLGFRTFIPVAYYILLSTVFNHVFTAFANIVVRPIELLINRHYIKDAKSILAKMKNLKIIGVTGSYGKTSSKYILSRILSEKFETLMTPESYNTPMGVVKTVRGSLKPTHEIFVCEMGAKYRKDIKELCDLVHPGYGIVTSIGPQHLESFKTLRNIIDTKMDLVGALADKRCAVLNMENKYISQEAPAESVGYSVEYVKGTDYWAEDISYGPEGVKFTLCTTTGKRVCFESKLLGKHNILNIVGAVAMAEQVGMSAEEAVLPVKRLESVPHRLQLKVKAGGITIIDDAFNSNIEGAKSAVEVLGSFPVGGRILITPGIVEAGDKEFELNYEFASSIGNNCDYVILVGKKQTEPMQKGLSDTNFNAENIFVAEDLKEAISVMNSLAKEGSTVLFENDLPDLYSENLI